MASLLSKGRSVHHQRLDKSQDNRHASTTPLQCERPITDQLLDKSQDPNRHTSNAQRQCDRIDRCLLARSGDHDHLSNDGRVALTARGEGQYGKNSGGGSGGGQYGGSAGGDKYGGSSGDGGSHYGGEEKGSGATDGYLCPIYQKSKGDNASIDVKCRDLRGTISKVVKHCDKVHLKCEICYEAWSTGAARQKKKGKKGAEQLVGMKKLTGVYFGSPANLRQHVLHNHKCQTVGCGRRFNSIDQLKKHERNCSDRQLQSRPSPLEGPVSRPWTEEELESIVTVCQSNGRSGLEELLCRVWRQGHQEGQRSVAPRQQAALSEVDSAPVDPENLSSIDSLYNATNPCLTDMATPHQPLPSPDAVPSENPSASQNFGDSRSLYFPHSTTNQIPSHERESSQSITFEFCTAPMESSDSNSRNPSERNMPVPYRLPSQGGGGNLANHGPIPNLSHVHSPHNMSLPTRSNSSFRDSSGQLYDTSQSSVPAVAPPGFMPPIDGPTNTDCPFIGTNPNNWQSFMHQQESYPPYFEEMQNPSHGDDRHVPASTTGNRSFDPSRAQHCGHHNRQTDEFYYNG